MTKANGKKYIVSAYENSEIPEPCWIDEGGFDAAYLSYGEVPAIFNDEGLKFEPYKYVYRCIRELTGESEWEPAA